jgi:hypothetical protein
MGLQGLYAIGIGLALVHANAANAAREDARRHAADPPAGNHQHHRDHDHSGAAKSREKTALRTAELKELSALKKEVSGLRRQVGTIDALRRQTSAVETLRQEMADLKQTVWGPNPLSLGLIPLRQQSSAVVEPMRVTLKLPDLGTLYQEPVRQPARVPDDPATPSLPSAIEERSAGKVSARSAVEEAKSYLIATATPGYTMARQGAEVAIGRLHPDFIVKLASAVRLAREAGMTGAGVFSAYRPPAFGIGGFSNKFNSLHSYGLAVDVTGIGSAGSRFAHRWQAIVEKVGLYLPYGPNNRREFNHTQLLPTKVAASWWHQNITASEPKDLRRMWLASGISAHVDEAAAEMASTPAAKVAEAAKVAAAGKPPSLASAASQPVALAPPAAPPEPAAPPAPPPERATAPRRARKRRPPKAATPAGRTAKGAASAGRARKGRTAKSGAAKRATASTRASRPRTRAKTRRQAG